MGVRRLEKKGSRIRGAKGSSGVDLNPSRLLEHAHLRRCPYPSSSRRTAKYASLLRISGALHLSIFEQSDKNYFFSTLLEPWAPRPVVSLGDFATNFFRTGREIEGGPSISGMAVSANPKRHLPLYAFLFRIFLPVARRVTYQALLPGIFWGSSNRVRGLGMR